MCSSCDRASFHKLRMLITSKSCIGQSAAPGQHSTCKCSLNGNICAMAAKQQTLLKPLSWALAHPHYSCFPCVALRSEVQLEVLLGFLMLACRQHVSFVTMIMLTF